MEKIDIKSMSLDELKEVVKEMGEPAFRAKQLYDWMHVKLVSSFDEMTNLSKDLRFEELQNLKSPDGFSNDSVHFVCSNPFFHEQIIVEYQRRRGWAVRCLGW